MPTIARLSTTRPPARSCRRHGRRAARGLRSRRNNFAPRLGFAWTATPETVVRGAYGIYYNQSALAPGEGLYFSAPYFHLDFFFPAQGLPPLTLYDPFPAYFPIPSPQSGFTFQRDLQTPYLHHLNVGVQRQLGPRAGRGGLCRVARLVAHHGARSQPAAPEHDLAQPAPESVLRRHHDPRIAGARVQQPAAQVRAASSMGLSVLAAYTLGKSEDDASGFFSSAGDPNFPAGQPDLEAECGRSSFDVRHRLSVGFVWDVPFDTLGRLAGRAAGRLAGERRGHAAKRAAVHGGAAAGDRQQQHRPRQSWLRLQRPSQRRGRSRARRPDRRALVQHGRVCDAGLRHVRQRGPQHARRAGLSEREPGADEAPAAGRPLELQLRIEAFNLFNRTNFNLPDNFLGSPTFGQILSAQSPRRFQLGAKAIF